MQRLASMARNRWVQGMTIPLLLLSTSWLIGGRKLLGWSLFIEEVDLMEQPISHTEKMKNAITNQPIMEHQETRLGGKLVKQALASSGTVVDKEEEKTTWYDASPTVQTLIEALDKSLSPEEKLHWYETPSFHPFPQKVECPSPIEFQHDGHNITELDLTDEQKDILRQQLEKSSRTIRDAFMPWIDKGGFHPDLILHGGKVAGLHVGIFGGKLHFWAKESSMSAKEKLLAEHLESVLNEFRKQKIQIPDVIFPYSERSIPPNSFTRQCARISAVPQHLQDRYDAVPVAGIAMDPTIHTGVVLMPNMYFGNLQVWDRYTKLLRKGGQRDVAWNKRNKRVFWRGKVRKNLGANIPRLEALQAAARDVNTSSHHLDIAFTSGCTSLEHFAYNVTRTSPLAPKWLPGDYFLNVTNCGGHMRTPHANFANYWAQLNLPGSSLGSYSKNLQNLWPTGAAVMIWNQTGVEEFYYDTLKSGITHVWVNETTLEPMAAKLFENNGELAQLMGKVGREWFTKHLTSRALLKYYRQWFNAWAALQRFNPAPDMLPDPCTCSGWIDADKKSHNGIKRCPYCGPYPGSIKRGCNLMMGVHPRSTLCK